MTDLQARASLDTVGHEAQAADAPALRVLHFYSHYFPDSFGGAEQVINQICRSTAAHGVRSSVLTLSPRPRPRTVQVDGHLVHRCPVDFTVASNRFSLRAVPALRRLAADADVLHYHFPWPFGDLAHLLSGVRRPFVVTYHSDVVRQRLLLQAYRPLRAWFLGQARALVASSPQYLASSDVLQAYRHKVRVIPNAMDPATLPPPEPDACRRWRARFGQRFFLFVGVLRYYKGLHVLLEALRGTDLAVAVVGSGPMQAPLQAQARRLGLDRVHFLGRVSEQDKASLIEACHGLVFPSHLRSEAFGMSMLEAAMRARPLICCEIGTGTTHINVDGVTGLVVPPEDPAALRAAMLRLRGDAELAARMGQAARERFYALFTSDRMGAAYARLYDDCVRQPAGLVPSVA